MQASDVPWIDPRRYRLGKALGCGAAGTVFRALDRLRQEPVAIKVLPLHRDPSRNTRVLREARALAALHHPRVLGIRDLGRFEQELWIVLDYLPGPSLAALPADRDPLPLLLDVAEGLEAVHGAGLVHRDVKPANVLLDRDGRAVLGDFGLVLDPARTRLTAAGTVVGSLGFMAPEVLQGGAATPASDWYSWGATLFRLLEGRCPHEWSEIRQCLEEGSWPELRFGVLEPDEPVAALLRRCLARDPSLRPSSRARVLELLAASRHAPLPASSGRPAPSTGRRNLVASLAVAGALALGLGTTPAARRPPSAPPPTTPDVATSLEQACEGLSGLSLLSVARRHARHGREGERPCSCLAPGSDRGRHLAVGAALASSRGWDDLARRVPGPTVRTLVRRMAIARAFRTTCSDSAAPTSRSLVMERALEGAQQVLPLEASGTLPASGTPLLEDCRGVRVGDTSGLRRLALFMGPRGLPAGCDEIQGTDQGDTLSVPLARPPDRHGLDLAVTLVGLGRGTLAEVAVLDAEGEVLAAAFLHPEDAPLGPLALPVPPSEMPALARRVHFEPFLLAEGALQVRLRTLPLDTRRELPHAFIVTSLVQLTPARSGEFDAGPAD